MRNAVLLAFVCRIYILSSDPAGFSGVRPGVRTRIRLTARRSWEEDADELLGLTEKTKENPFDILRLSRDSEQALVRPAFRKLAAVLHPDVPGTGDAASFRKLLWAYRELSSPDWRRWARQRAPDASEVRLPGIDLEDLFQAPGAHRCLKCTFALIIGANMAPVDEEEAKMWQAVAFRGAVDKGDLEEVNEMLENGSNPNYKMPDGSNWTVLMLASNGGHEELVQKFTKGGKGVSDKDPQGFQAIMLAAIKGHANVCRSLLEKKADANACNEDGETPLMMAAAMGHQELVRLLLDAGADANCQDKNSMSALKKASRWGHVGCLKTLLAELPNLDLREMKHCLLFGKLYGHPEVVAEIQKVLEPPEEDIEEDAVDAGPELDDWEEMYRRRQAEKEKKEKKEQQTQTNLVKRILEGSYEEKGRNHGRPVFRKSLGQGESVAIYYWDEKDGADCDGWWIGAEVGGDMVFAFNINQASMLPPRSGWRFPLRGPVDHSLRIVPGPDGTVQIQFGDISS
ncbi:Kidins220 [Symbiodinium necroappetens]|uniref:Kidins220 protein n=1 Tax=Symbiodinium necroappetens TaxID=1628268 RepID=A0A812WE28_9DINO|nr:Kidins220 [Symbiodinium necroappetens]